MTRPAGGEQGLLYVVATPIGNLGDLAPRVRDVLAQADIIAAEDTRRCQRLLAHLELGGRAVLSLHEHNESERVPELVARLQDGAQVALVSDAGTPLVSDPGFPLVRAARAAALEVRAVPGACAAVAALSISGLPPDRFVFEGFLPARPAARRKRLAELVDEPRTLLLYESSHRVAATLDDIVAVLGAGRPVSLAREISKRHEQSVTLPAAELGDWLAADTDRRRGEFVLVVAGATTAPARYEVELDELLAALGEQLPVRAAAKTAARLTGVAPNAAYQRLLALRDSGASE